MPKRRNRKNTRENRPVAIAPASNVYSPQSVEESVNDYQRNFGFEENENLYADFEEDFQYEESSSDEEEDLSSDEDTASQASPASDRSSSEDELREFTPRAKSASSSSETVIAPLLPPLPHPGRNRLQASGSQKRLPETFIPSLPPARAEIASRAPIAAQPELTWSQVASNALTYVRPALNFMYSQASGATVRITDGVTNTLVSTGVTTAETIRRMTTHR